MSAAFGFRNEDAEYYAARAVGDYFNNALRTIAARCGLEKSLERDPAAFAIQFAPLLSAMIEAEAREYTDWVFSDRLEALADASREALGELGKDIAAAAQYQGDATREGLAGLGNAIKRAQP